MKIGLIRCQLTEDLCPATTCLKFISHKKGGFEDIEGETELIGINSCGGCSGKRAVMRASEMVKRGADAIAFASCITRGNPIGFKCPHYEQMKEAIINKIGDSITIIEYTH